MGCDCAARLRQYAAEVHAWGAAIGKVDVLGSHAVHDAAHYQHAAQIVEGQVPTVEETIDVKYVEGS